MASWRKSAAKRAYLERHRERGMVVFYWFCGTAVAGALLVFGVWCLTTDAIPIATRGQGTLWVGGRMKTGFGILGLSLAAATHFGFVWSRVRALRLFWLPGLILALCGCLIGAGIAM
jgi:hypothetical protein